MDNYVANSTSPSFQVYLDLQIELYVSLKPEDTNPSTAYNFDTLYGFNIELEKPIQVTVGVPPTIAQNNEYVTFEPVTGPMAQAQYALNTQAETTAYKVSNHAITPEIDSFGVYTVAKYDGEIEEEEGGTGGNHNNGGTAGTGGGSGVRTGTTAGGSVTVTTPSGPSTMGGFSDVLTSNTFATEIAWAQANGILGGYSDGTFRPNANTTRQALWMVLGRLAGVYPATMAEARQWAISAGISDGTSAEGNMSRQQMITMLYRFDSLNLAPAPAESAGEITEEDVEEAINEIVDAVSGIIEEIVDAISEETGEDAG